MQSIFQHYLREAEGIKAPTSPVWRHQREVALEDFLKKGFPTVQNEGWRYIARSPILQQPFKMGGVPTAATSMVNLPLPVAHHLSTIRLICLNGQFHLGSYLPLPKGLQIERITRVMQHQPEILMEDRFKKAMYLGHGFNALNTTFSQEGVMITVADGCLVEPIVELWYVSHRLPPEMIEPLMFCTRNNVHVGQGSAVKIIEYAVMLENDTRLVSVPSVCTNTLTTLTLQSGAEVTWAQSVRVNDYHSHIGQLAVQQHQDSTFHSESLVFGGGLVRHTLSVDLCGDSAACELYGLSGVKQQHQVDHQVVVSHQADHTRSHVHYRAIADDQGRASFSGEVTAKSGIHQMNSHQGNYNLLLSDQAEINTRPRLALFSDDIQCTHGTTVGALDTDALFYLQTRGLSEQVARLMLIQAFSQVIWQATSLLLASQKTLLDAFQVFMRGDESFSTSA